jgi:hypothetical protein
MNLNPEKAKTMFKRHGYSENDDHVKGFITRLKNMQDAVKSGKYKDMEDLLKQNKNSTSKGSWHDKYGFVESQRKDEKGYMHPDPKQPEKVEAFRKRYHPEMTMKEVYEKFGARKEKKSK